MFECQLRSYIVKYLGRGSLETFETGSVILVSHKNSQLQAVMQSSIAWVKESCKIKGDSQEMAVVMLTVNNANSYYILQFISIDIIEAIDLKWKF